MPQDPIREYQEARKEFAAAKAKADEFVTVIVEAGHNLREWPWVGVANLPNANFPSGSKHYIDAKKWPSIVDPTEVLQAAHAAEYRLRQAWSSIPSTDREGLQPPPRLRER
ncbi:MAG: hypothetical protein WD557_17235 [Dehalococcoidia bacterium]